MNKTQLINHLQFTLGETFDKFSFRDEIAFIKNKGIKVPCLTISELLENGIVKKWYDVEYLICDKDYSPKAIEIDGYYYIVNIVTMYRWI